MRLEVSVKKGFKEFSLESSFIMNLGKCGIFGPSGSGKSTLMMILAGLITPDHGRISLDEEILFDSTKNINMQPEKRCIGVVFQHAHLFPHLNVKGNLFYGWKRVPPAARKINPELIISSLNLETLLQRRVADLSGGERQRVALGRTILASPKLILMDEPLSGLDNAMKYRVISYTKTVLTDFNIPFMFISHSLWEMQLMTDEVLVFSPNRGQEKIDINTLIQQHSNNLCNIGANPNKREISAFT